MCLPRPVILVGWSRSMSPQRLSIPPLWSYLCREVCSGRFAMSWFKSRGPSSFHFEITIGFEFWGVDVISVTRSWGRAGYDGCFGCSGDFSFTSGELWSCRNFKFTGGELCSLRVLDVDFAFLKLDLNSVNDSSGFDSSTTAWGCCLCLRVISSWSVDLDKKNSTGCSWSYFVLVFSRVCGFA